MNRLIRRARCKPLVSPVSAALAVLTGGILAAGTVACSGTSTVASSPKPTATAPATQSSATPGTSFPATAPSTTTAAAVAASYYRAIAARNYRLAFTYLAANVTGPGGRKLTLSAFLQLARMLDGQGGPVTSFSAAAFHSMVVMTIYRKKFGPYHAHLQVARDNNGWTIVSIDRI
jgi:hypothetical protein